MKSKNRVVYQLVVEDMQTVAMDYLERELTEEEQKIVSLKIADYVPWYDAICECMAHELKKEGSI